MKTNLDCVACMVRQMAEALELTACSESERERLMRQLLRTVAETDWEQAPAVIAQKLQRAIRSECGGQDPYQQVKERANRAALNLLPELTAAVKRQPDPRQAALRLAIAGNLMDEGAQLRVAHDGLEQLLAEVWQRPLHGDSAALFRAAAAAEQILYLADNAGEIVFDRLLITALPTDRITVAVRGTPIINDATLADAQQAGLTDLVPVIDNGSDAPGTVVEECSPVFRSLFKTADLIIAKGQGNYETLYASQRPIFFLLTVKCPLVAKIVGAAVGTMVVLKGGQRALDGGIKQ